MCWSSVGVTMVTIASRVLALDGVFTIEASFYLVDFVFVLLLCFWVATVYRLVFVQFYGIAVWSTFSSVHSCF